MMVKADSDRDYYRDLELQPDADANEVKKAFKKLALKYHPDRNPGKEVECNSKFQTIQSANEVLTDPQLRAKYDAQRIRSGLLHTYTTASPPTSRPPVPTRPPASAASNFPPPPRPPPPPQPKSNFPHPSSGAQKYTNARFARETASSWTNSSTDDTKSKTNDFKAWEQMRARHGQGPLPAGRSVPPKTSRASTFQPGREVPNTTPAPPTSSSRRSHWDRFQESQTGMPSMARSNTTRASPSRPKFAPGTPGGDEPQAQGSAYFTVSSKGERPPNARSQTHMPPPPSAVPTAKKPDHPVHAPREPTGLNEPFGRKKTRTSTQFQREKGERVNLMSPPNAGFHRSATSATRDSNSRTGFYESIPTSMNAAHLRSASKNSNNHSASPTGAHETKLPGSYSSSSSGSSSDEDGMPIKSATSRVPQAGVRQPRVPPSVQPPRGFNIYAKVGDEKMAPQASLGGGGYSGTRRHSAVDLSTDKPTEGFQEHRMKHDAERSQQPPSGGPGTPGSPVSNGSQPSLARSHSWQGNHGQGEYGQDHRDRWGSPPKDKDHRSPEGSQAAKTTMYDFGGYIPISSPSSYGHSPSGTPSSDKWSDQWPFNSPKRPRAVTAESPPYWAIPSSLPPIQETESRKRRKSFVLSSFNIQHASIADNDPFSSFGIPHFSKNSSGSPTPLHRQSSERIDTKFSPEGWHGKFFEPPASHTATPLRTVSPTEQGRSQQERQAAGPETHTNGQTVDENAAATPNAAMPPPPPVGQEKYHEERWVPHLSDMRFDMPQSPQASSPIRQNTRKRVRARGPKIVSAQPTVNDVEDEPTAPSATAESLESSKANSDVDAMDIDEPTPPKNTLDNQPGGSNLPAVQLNGTAHKPRRVPTLPPRTNEHNHAQAGAHQFNLGDLSHIYPFAPSNEGLGNMNDMATTLPFESKASPTKAGADVPLQRVNLPQPPVCPQAPFSLTQHSCDKYCWQVRSYMDEWNKFASKMANLLSARQIFQQESQGFKLADVQDNGYDKYMKGLEESRRSRVHFDVACDKHYKTMQDFGLFREEMRRGRGEDSRIDP